jgi:hypothetical protein
MECQTLLRGGTLFSGWIASDYRERAMPTKPGLTRQEHEELGKILKQLRDEALCIALFLETAYAKQSSLMYF